MNKEAKTRFLWPTTKSLLLKGFRCLHCIGAAVQNIKFCTKLEISIKNYGGYEKRWYSTKNINK